MPERLGRYSILKVDVNGVGGSGADWQEIPQRRDFSMEETSNLVDVTHAGTGGQAKKLPSDNDWTASCDVVYWPGDPVIKYLLDQLRQQKSSNPKQTWLQVDDSSVGGLKEEAPCWLENVSDERPRGDVMTRSFSFSGNAAWITSP